MNSFEQQFVTTLLVNQKYGTQEHAALRGVTRVAMGFVACAILGLGAIVLSDQPANQTGVAYGQNSAAANAATPTPTTPSEWAGASAR